MKLDFHSSAAIAGIKNALQGKSEASLDGLVKNSGSLKRVQGESFGAVWAVHQIAERIEICKALGGSQNATLALSQIYSRLIRPGASILATVRFLMTCAFCAICNVKEAFNEDDLYRNKQNAFSVSTWKAGEWALLFSVFPAFRVNFALLFLFLKIIFAEENRTQSAFQIFVEQTPSF